ncbi:MAG: hypothetical protein JRJ00_10625 [Deltaproteobacteria bacterium]|nr:hypothetical protein [Deltaproteobacteria bacterium]
MFIDPGNIITNFSQGGKIIHHPYTELGAMQILKIAEIARNAGNAFGSNILGVDIMFHNDQPLVVEAQTFTGFPHKDYFNLPKYLIYSSGLFVD